MAWTVLELRTCFERSTRHCSSKRQPPSSCRLAFNTTRMWWLRAIGRSFDATLNQVKVASRERPKVRCWARRWSCCTTSRTSVDATRPAPATTHPVAQPTAMLASARLLPPQWLPQCSRLSAAPMAWTCWASTFASALVICGECRVLVGWCLWQHTHARTRTPHRGLVVFVSGTRRKC